MSKVARKIMDNQDSDRLYLPVRPEHDAYIREVVQHAMRPMDTFPAYVEPVRTDEVIEIDKQIAELQMKRNEIVGEVPGEEVIHGIRTRRRADGSMPVSFLIPGVVGPVVDTDRVSITLRSLWDPKPTGDDSHQVILSTEYRTAFAGDQRTCMALDFITRGDDDEDDYETDRYDDTEDVG